MELYKKLILGFVLIFITCWLLIKWLFNSPCIPPERPAKVPSSAFWSGGCDGGDWIEYISNENGKYRFRIYRDWDGVLKMDTYFRVINNSEIDLEINEFNVQNLICCYSQSLNDSTVLLKVMNSHTDNNFQFLTSIYPALGGEDWEMIKEKSGKN